MFPKCLALVVLSTLVLAATPVLAGDGCPSAKAAAESPSVQSVHETAIFSVPQVADEATVKSLTMALAKQEGVISAKANSEGGTFQITFVTGKTNAETLAKAVAEVAPESKLEKVEPATVAKHDCSKCPSKASCSKTK